VRVAPPIGSPPGIAVWKVGPGGSPMATLDAVHRAAAEEAASIDPDSVEAWRSLADEDQRWLAGSFFLVGFRVVLADGKVEPGEVERAWLKTDDIAAHTRSYVVNWAIGMMVDRQIAKTVTDAVLSPSVEPAFAASRSALSKLPEPDRCRMAAALWTTALHAIAANYGSPPTPEMIEVRELIASIDRLGLDLTASMAWVETNGP
jgi:hypothetical protein